MTDYSSQLDQLSPAKRALLEKMLLEKAVAASVAERIPRRAATDAAPMSFAQQRLWFLDQMGTASRAYNLPINLRLRGPLNPGVLAQCLTEILRRHEALRTSFHNPGGQPSQFVAPPAPVDLPLRDLSGIPVSAQEETVRRLAIEEGARLFDLARSPMLRARLIRLSADEHILLVTMHHIASDGWSISVFMRELSALYPAFAAGHPSPLPELSIQYADFALWQRKRMDSEAAAPLLRYWREQLAGITPLVLPTHRARRAVHDAQGAAYAFQIPADLTAALHAIRNRHGATLFMLLLAAFQVLLQRYTGQDRVPVGSPAAGRGRSQLEGLIGFFVNSLVLTSDLSGDPSFSSLLGQVKETVLGAFAHQELPFERLVEELQPDRDPARNPLFQVMFAVQQRDAIMPSFNLPGLEVTALEFRDITVRFDLEMHLWETDEGIAGYVPYNAELFDETTIAAMMRHYTALLQSIAENPGQRISELPLLNHEERHRILARAAQKEAPPAASIPDCFEAQARRTPDAIVVSEEDQQITYAALNEQANRLAHELQQHGVGLETPVALYAERSIEAIVALLAILKAGGAYLPLDPSDPPERLSFVFNDTGAKLLLAQTQPNFDTTSLPVVSLDANAAWRKHNGAQNPPRALSPLNLAYIMYTSGSTGTPKGTGITHQGVVRLAKGADYIRLNAEESMLQFAPLAFDASTFEIWGTLLNGARLEIMPPGKASLADLGRVLRQRSVTTLWLTAGLFRLIVDENLEDLASVRQLLAGGDVLPQPQVEKLFQSGWQGTLVNGYGPTENTTFTCCLPMSAPRPLAPSIPIGRPIAHTQAHILDSHCHPVPDGIPGELYATGAGLARGYWNHPALTAASFLPAPFRAEPDERMYKTGDADRWLQTGEIEFLGRLDRQLKLRGFRVEPREIEAALAQHSAVTSAVVLPQPVQPTDGPSGEKRLTAWIVPALNSPAVAEMRHSLAARQLSSWEAVFEKHIYDAGRQGTDPYFNTMGWISSYDRSAIPESHMREWAAGITGEILGRRPRRVLEIGCGTGMLLFQIAPFCEFYQGTDFSEVSLRYIQARLDERPMPHVQLSRQRAEDFTGLPEQSFDAIILNSVIQYFPSADYLMEVIEGSLRLLRPGGFLFLGDLRHHGLLDVFHSSVQLARASSSSDIEGLRRNIQRQLAQETELTLAPQLFPALRQRFSAIQSVKIRLQRGREHNELSKYRYNVVLDTTPSERQATPPARIEGGSLASIRAHLESEKPESLLWTGLPNARLATDLRAWELLRSRNAPRQVSGLRQAAQTATAAIDPEDLWSLASELGYRSEICWSPQSLGSLDALLTHSAQAAPEFPLESSAAPLQPLSAYANQPLRAAVATQLIPELRAFLESRLPAYMIPGAFVLLDRLPLTPNGKLDRAALPMPDELRTEAAAYVAPRNPVEETLAKIWQELLGLSRIGVDDNFFALGGHSLLATQVIARIRQSLHVDLPLRLLFETPTIAALAQAVAQADPQSGRAAAIAALRGKIDNLTPAEIRQLLEARKQVAGQ